MARIMLFQKSVSLSTGLTWVWQPEEDLWRGKGAVPGSVGRSSAVRAHPEAVPDWDREMIAPMGSPLD